MKIRIHNGIECAFGGLLVVCLVSTPLQAARKSVAPPAEVKLAAAAKPVAAKPVPVVEFKNDATVTQWGYLRLGGDPRGADKLVSTVNAALSGAGAAGLADRFTLLPQKWVTRDRWGKAANGIDIDAVIGGEEGVITLLATMLKVPAPRKARLSFMTFGRRSRVRLWIDGNEINQQSLLHLEKGVHPVIAVAAVLPRDGEEKDPTTVRLCARFGEITDEDEKAHTAWLASLQQATKEAMDRKAKEWQKKIKIDKSTLRGKKGYFRVGRSKNGSWWFIDPDGDPFFCNAVCSVNAGGMGGRRARRWPVSDENVKAWIEQMQGWGFNCLGSWTTKEFFNKGIAYCEVIETWYEGPYLQGGGYRKGVVPDVFDPAWAENLDKKCKELCAPRKKDELLLGYFLDNERGFRYLIGYGAWIKDDSPIWKVTDRGRVWPLLQLCLSLSPNKPAARAAWDFVLSRHGGDIVRVGEAWGVPLKEKADVGAISKRREIIVSAGLQKDQQAFLRLWVTRYYETAVKAIRKHDPNHLILGTRWGGAPPVIVLEEEAKWTDVVSANNYKDVMYEMMDRYHRVQQKPILIGEFGDYGDYFSGIPWPIEPPGGLPETVRTPAKLREAMDRVFTHPGVVGWTWYRWRGGPPTEEQVGIYSRAAFRAPFIKADWDRPRSVPKEALHGQIFMYLDGGIVSERQFNPEKSAAEPAKWTNRGELRLGFTCREGRWDDRVFGNIVEGRVLEQKTAEGRVELKIDLDKYPGAWSGVKGSGAYELKLERNAGQLKGVFEGTWNGMPAKGVAIGYVHRALINPAL